MSEKDGHYTFKGVVMSALYSLSEMTAVANPPDGLLDMIWAILNPLLSDDDKEAWFEHTVMQHDPYQSTVNKSRLISLVLYKNSLFPEKDYITNRKYKLKINPSDRSAGGGMKTHVTDDIAISDFFIRHLHGMVKLTTQFMGYGTHIDIMWGMLSPYVTEQDFSNWDANNKKYGTDDSMAYRWNIEKVRICMEVLDRAEFLWETGMTDEPESFVKDGGEIGVRQRGK